MATGFIQSVYCLLGTQLKCIFQMFDQTVGWGEAAWKVAAWAKRVASQKERRLLRHLHTTRGAKVVFVDLSLDIGKLLCRTKVYRKVHLAVEPLQGFELFWFWPVRKKLGHGGRQQLFCLREAELLVLQTPRDSRMHQHLIIGLMAFVNPMIVLPR